MRTRDIAKYVECLHLMKEGLGWISRTIGRNQRGRKQQFPYHWRFHSLILGYALLSPSPELSVVVHTFNCSRSRWMEFQDSLGYIRKPSWKTTKPLFWQTVPIADLITVLHCTWQNALRVDTSTAGFCFRPWTCKPVEWLMRSNISPKSWRVVIMTALWEQGERTLPYA